MSASSLPRLLQIRGLEVERELQEHDGLSYLFISHDLAVVRRVAHRVGVMRGGRLLELRPTVDVFDDPQHEYTRTLLAAIAGRRRAVA